MSTSIQPPFRDSNYQPVSYDGSPIERRLSVYGAWVHEGKLLLVKHHGETYWDIPGGGVELEESIEQALSRESREEAGCLLKTDKLIGYDEDWFFHSGDQKFYRSLQLFFLATGSLPLTKPSDPRVIKVAFYSPEEVKDKLYPHVYDIITQAKIFAS